MVLPTDFHFEPTDAYDTAGRRVMVAWASPMSATVSLDVADVLAEGESVENPVATIWRLKGYGEADHADVTSGTTIPDGASFTGSILSARVADLDRGRFYRLYFTFGPSNNRRSRSIPIQVSSNS